MKKRGASENNNKNGSNSNYDIAENPINLVVNDRRAHSKNEKYDDCEKSVFALAENFASYDYWVAKGFLLLSDVYVKKGNIFQAKQTLQSIIDNSEGQDLVMIAREKLSAIGDTN